MAALKKNDSGVRVKTLQLALNKLGYALPRFGADGHLGFETLEAVEAFAGDEDTDNTPNDTVPEALEAGILAAAATAPEPKKVPKPEDDPLGAPYLSNNFLDARKFYAGKEYNTRNPWTSIDTICLHQMAVNGGSGWKRWVRLAIHIVAPTEGPAALINDLNRRVAHGHGWNSRSVGVEVEGHFAGVEGKPATHWTPGGAKGSRLIPMKLTPLQVEGALSALRWAIAEVERNGGKIKYIGAHRQSYGQKSSDPGELIWKAVALPLMKEFGLSIGPTLKHHKYPGKPIPEAWDPSQKGVKY